MGENEANSAILRSLGHIEGQVAQLMQMMQTNQAATNQRLDDMRASINARMDSQEKRIDKLETNERNTALRSSASAAIAAAIVSSGMAAIKHFTGQ